MKKSKTTKPAKKPYSSVKELLEDNNSKIKLTPFTTEEYMENLKKAYLKKEIEEIAIPWSKFHNPSPNLFDRTYDTKLLTPLLIDLLDLVKENKIKVRCGVAMMQLLSYYTNYSPCTQKIHIGGCEIITELDFNLEKFDMVYDDIYIVGKGVPEKETSDNNNEYFDQALKEVAEKVCPPKKKKSLWQRIFG